MFKNYKIPVRICAAVACGTVLYKNYPSLINIQPLHASVGLNTSRKFYPASAEYPDLTKNRSIMGRNMSLNLYAKLRDRITPNGFTIDDAIQTGIDNGGKFSFTGIVAGDEQSYETFKEIFDKVIEEKHEFLPNNHHVTDYDWTKLNNATFDSDYVVSIRIRILRNLRGYCLPSYCTRGERRDIESVVAKSLYGLPQKGTYYSLKDLSPEEEKTLESVNS